MPSDIEALLTASQTGTSSRKRSYAQITRSESRSLSPDIPSKRRRTSFKYSPTSSMDSSPRPFVRTSGRDGFDLRRPVSSIPVENPAQEPIDLTVDDDDTPPSASRITSLAPRRTPSQSDQHNSPRRNLHSFPRAPPFGDGRPPQLAEVISLSDDEYEAPRIRRRSSTNTPTVELSSSPDVEFVQERPARTALNDQISTDTIRHEPPAVAQRSSLGEFLRRSTQLMFGIHANNQGGRALDEVVMDRIDGLHDRLLLGPHRTNEDQALEIIDDYDVVSLDYQVPAFAMGPRSSETPQVNPTPYKGPSPARPGFTRNYDEETVLICPYCRDELSVGKEDVKQQVWIIRQCGHAYCGACASSRVLSKGANKRESRKANGHKSLPFRYCVVDGCKKPVTSKTSMFPIYL